VMEEKMHIKYKYNVGDMNIWNKSEYYLSSSTSAGTISTCAPKLKSAVRRCSDFLLLCPSSSSKHCFHSFFPCLLSRTEAYLSS
jgi:hypothetical protein